MAYEEKKREQNSDSELASLAKRNKKHDEISRDNQVVHASNEYARNIRESGAAILENLDVQSGILKGV